MKIGIALGSGGPKGLSHIGVMKVLLENNIKFDMIAGASIGSFVGGVYAVHMDIKKVENIAKSNDMKTVIWVLFDPTVRLGLIKGKKAMQFIRQVTSNRTIESLPIKFFAVATDLQSGNPHVFEKGSLADAIRASISIPFMFEPFRINDKLYLDGGLTLPVPARVLKERGADLVIAVNLNSRLPPDDYVRSKAPTGLYRIASSAISILQYNLVRENLKYADIVIEPDVADVGWDSFWKAENVIREGEIAAIEKLNEIRAATRAKRIFFLKKDAP